MPLAVHRFGNSVATKKASRHGVCYLSESLQIIKSPNDHRRYQYLKLDNNLSVLLVEDELASQAAASMAVNVGHFDDP
ncbi:MAG: secreted Zn-dependent insulinase-like peptidase, partial [Shewanella sp.]